MDGLPPWLGKARVGGIGIFKVASSIPNYLQMDGLILSRIYVFRQKCYSGVFQIETMKLNKKVKSLIILSLILAILMGTGMVLKRLFLSQIERRIQSSFGYTRLYLSLIPPALVLEDARSKSLSPFFSAKKVAVRISFRSLLTKEKPINVYIDHPVLRVYEIPKGEKEGKAKIELSFPFSIQKGLIREGELYYWGREDRYRAKGINALFLQRGDRFSIKAEADESLIFFSSAQEPLEGRVSIDLDGQAREILVKRFVFQGKSSFIKAEGNVHDLFKPELELKTFMRLPMPLVAKFFELPFSWEGIAEGEGRLMRKNSLLAFRGELFGEELELNKVAMGRIRAKIDFVEGDGGVLEVSAQKKSLPPEFLKIQFRKGRVWGVARRFFLDPILNFIGLPYPISSPVWGNFSVEKGNLWAEGEFRDEILKEDSDKFSLSGRFTFERKSNGQFSFSSSSLTSTFARISVRGEADEGDRMDMQIQGEVRDLAQARRFTSLILAKNFEFPEIRGKGQVNLRIFGDFVNPQVEASFLFSPGGFDGFDVDSAKGQARIAGGQFFGRFDVDDLFMKGKITLFAGNEGLKVGIQMDRGIVERIFPHLEIGLPLRGEASGHFEVVEQRGVFQLKGKFSSPMVTFEKLELHALSGEVSWQLDSLSLSNLHFTLHEGRVRADLLARPSSKEFDLEAHAEGIDLSSISSRLRGKLFFDLEGKGFIGQDLASGPFEIQNLEISPLQKTEIRGDLKAGYAHERLTLELKGNFFPGDNEVNISFNFPFKENELSAEIKGTFTDLSLLLPWRGARGRVDYIAEIKGPRASPRVRGVIDFQGSLFPFPRFAQALQDYSGLMFIEGRKLSLRSFKARLGGGDVQAFGEIELGKGGAENIDLKMEGKNMLLSPIERMRAFSDGTLNLIKDPSRFLLQGELKIQRLSWRREIYEKIVFSSSPYYSSQREPGFFDGLTLNVRMRADDNAWMENRLGRIRGRFDLTIGGSIFVPVLLGDIEVIEGNVYFQDRKFEILRGMLSFFNPSTIEPYLNFKGETYVKNYRVNFSLTGFIDQLNPELSSSPPLPPEDVLALLAMGEAFKRTTSYDTTTQLSTASLLSFQLSEEAERRAEKLFSIDRFRITPFVLGSSAEMTARLTIGKRIARDFSILYSTNLTTQREELTRIEWELTDDFSIVSTRDEKGRLSIDVKVHRRF